MKIKLLLILLLTSVSIGLKAQNFENNWEKEVGSYSWFSAATNVTGVAYNPVTKKLYVSVRGNSIQIIDPEFGNQPATPAAQTLQAPATVGTFDFAKVAVTPTGEIFAITAAPTAGATLGQCTIYYWASEAAAPVVVSDDVVWLGERAGDTFDVTGSGDNVVIYVGSLSAVNVQVIAKDTDKKFKSVRVLKLNASLALAGGGISAVTTGPDSEIWVNAAGAYVVRKYSQDPPVAPITVATRTALPTAADLVAGAYTTPNTISKKFIAVKYFTIGVKEFLAVSGAPYTAGAATSGEELALHIYDVTGVNDNPSKVLLVATTKLTNTLQANVLPSAHIDFYKKVNVDGSVTMQFFQLITKNGLAAHTIEFKADGTLPVTLSSFTAAVVNNQNQLNWTTASEQNNAGFEIESSQDGVTFQNIGFVASKASNSNSNLNYSFQDKTAASGTTYYRLKQVDLDGKFNYSEVKVVSNKLSANNITVFPNPTTDFVAVGGLDMYGVSVNVFNSSGKKVNAKVIGDQVSLAGLANGIYLLKISKDGKVVKTTKVVKR